MVDQPHPTPPAAKRKRCSPDISSVDRANPPAKKPKTINSTTPSITTARSTISPSTSKFQPKPARQNAEAGPSKQKNLTPTRVSTRVSKPTEKKAALLSQTKKPRPSQVQLNDESDFDSDGTPPLYLTISSQPTKRKKSIPTDTIKRQRATTQKSDVHLGAIEVSSGSEDDPRPKSTKAKKKAPAKPVSSSEIIDLCSSGDEKVSKKRAAPVQPRLPTEEVVEIVSTDEEASKPAPIKSPVPSNASVDIERQPSPPPTTPTPPLSAMEESNEITTELPKENAPDSEPVLPVVSPPEAQESTKTPTPIGDIDPEQAVQDTANMSLDSLQAMYKASMESAKKLPRLKAKKSSAFSMPKPTNRSRPIVFADSASPTATPTLQTHIYFSRTLSASKKRALSKKAEFSSHKASSMTATGSSSGHASPAVQSAPTSPSVTRTTSGSMMTENTTGSSHGSPSMAALLLEKAPPDPIVKPPTAPMLTLVKEKSKSKQSLDFVLGIMKTQGYLPTESVEPGVPKEGKGKAKQKEPLFLPSDESKSSTPTPRCMPSVEPSSLDLTRSKDVESSSSESLLEVANALMLPAATPPPESTSVTPSAVDDAASGIQTPLAEINTDSVSLNVEMLSSEKETTSAVNENETPLNGTLAQTEIISASSVDDMVCDDPLVDHFVNGDPAVSMMYVDESNNDVLKGATPEASQVVVESSCSDAMVCDNPPINNNNTIVLPPIVQNPVEGFKSNADTLQLLRHNDGLPDDAITKIGCDMDIDVVNSNPTPSLQTGATHVTVGQPLSPISDPQPAFGNLLPAFEATADATTTKSASRLGIVSNVDKDDQCAATVNGKSPTSTIDSVSPATPSHPQIGSDMLIWNLPPPRIIRSPDVSIFDFDLVKSTIPPITPSMMIQDDDLGDLDLAYPQDA